MAAAADASPAELRMLYASDDYETKFRTFMNVYLESIGESIRLSSKKNLNNQDSSLLPPSNLPKSSLNNNSAKKTAKNPQNSGNKNSGNNSGINSSKKGLTRNNYVDTSKISEVFKEFIKAIAIDIFKVETPEKSIQELFSNLQLSISKYENYLRELKKQNRSGNFVYLNVHGGYNANPINRVVPDNTIIIFTTPINRFGYTCKFTTEEKVDFFRDKANRLLFQNYMTCIDKGIDNRAINNSNKPNLSELNNIFKNAIVFLPFQGYYDIALSYTQEDAEAGYGIYKNLNNQESYEKTGQQSIWLSDYITEYYLTIPTILTTPTFFVVSCCRSLNHTIHEQNKTKTNNLITKGQIMYKYEHFMLYYNTFLLNCVLGTESRLKSYASSRNFGNSDINKYRLIFSDGRIEEFKQLLLNPSKPEHNGIIITEEEAELIISKIKHFISIIFDLLIKTKKELKPKDMFSILQSQFKKNIYIYLKNEKAKNYFNDIFSDFFSDKEEITLKTLEKLERIQQTSLRLGDTQRTFLHKKLNAMLKGTYKPNPKISALADRLISELQISL